MILEMLLHLIPYTYDLILKREFRGQIKSVIELKLHSTVGS